MNIRFEKPKNLTGDFWGALAAMLVAMPSAIAFGVTIYAPLGSEYAAYGALAGILGATFLGLIAPVLGGANRLISAPCAPAAAVLSAFAIDYTAKGGSPEIAVLMIALLGLFAGALQIGFGALRLGGLIKYMPYTVVSGYLSGVGLYIIASQTPKLLGMPKGSHFWESLSSPASWQWEGIVIGVVTASTMVFSQKITKAVPAAILALLAGSLTYFCLGFAEPSLWSLGQNTLVIGPIGAEGGGFLEAMGQKIEGMKGFSSHDFAYLITPALTLAALLSKTTHVFSVSMESRAARVKAGVIK